MSNVRLLVLTLCLKLFDVLSTYHLLSAGGLDVEANPVVKIMLAKQGLLVGLNLNFFLFAITMCVLYIGKRKLLLKTSAIFMSIICLNNLLAIVINIILENLK